MANTEKTKVIKIDTGQAEKSVKELRQELKDYQNAVLSAKKGTEEWEKSFEGLSKAKQELNDLTDLTKVAGWEMSDVFSSATKSIASMSAGLQVGQAALNLLGTESEDVAKAIQKMQNIMALTQGLSTIASSVKQMKLLWTWTKSQTIVQKAWNVATAAANKLVSLFTGGLKAQGAAMTTEAIATRSATIATKAFRAALISTGIGAIVVLIGSLIGAIEKLIDKFSLFGSGAKKAAEEARAAVENIVLSFNALNGSYELNTDQISKRYAIAKKVRQSELDLMIAQGKTEQEIHKKRIDNINAEISENKKIVEQLKWQLATNEKLAKTSGASTYLDNETIKANLRSHLDQIAKLQTMMENADDKTQKTYQDTINKRQMQADILSKILELRNKIAEAELGTAELLNKRQITQLNFEKKYKEAQVESLKLTIQRKEAEDKNYKNSYAWYNANINYFNQLIALYNKDTNEYKKAQNEKQKFMSDYQEFLKKNRKDYEASLVVAGKTGIALLESIRDYELNELEEDFKDGNDKIKKFYVEGTDDFIKGMEANKADLDKKSKEIWGDYWKGYYSYYRNEMDNTLANIGNDYNRRLSEINMDYLLGPLVNTIDEDGNEVEKRLGGHIKRLIGLILDGIPPLYEYNTQEAKAELERATAIYNEAVGVIDKQAKAIDDFKSKYNENPILSSLLPDDGNVQEAKDNFDMIIAEFKRLMDAAKEGVMPKDSPEESLFGEMSEEQIKSFIEEYSDVLLMLENVYGEGASNVIDLGEKVAEAMENLAQNVDAQFNNIRNELEPFDSIVTDMVSMSYGLGAAWGKAFATINDGFISIAKNAKTGEKSWAKWGQVATMVTSSIGDVLVEASNQQDTSSREGFEASKKYQIGASVMSMATGILQASMLASNPEVIAAFTPYGAIALAAAESAMIAAMGAAQIAKIKNMQFDGGGDIPTASASMAQIAAPVQYSATVADTTENTDGQDNRIWVSVSEIDDVQSGVRANAAEARF